MFPYKEAAMLRVFPHRRRQRARSVVRNLMRIFGEHEALSEVRCRRQAKELLRAFLRRGA